MLKKLPGLLCGLSLFVAASALAQFSSEKSVVEPRGPGGLDAPSKQVDLPPPPASPAPQPPKNVEGKSMSPINPPSTPATRTGY